MLPPLRDRREDILSLFERFVTSLAPQRSFALDLRFAEALLVYDWPLNVRELVHLAQRLVALHEDEPVLRKSMLPAHWTRNAAEVSPTPGAKKRSPADDPAERELLLAALREHQGNVSRAAKAAGVSRSRAYRLMDAHPNFDISPSSKPDAKS